MYFSYLEKRVRLLRAFLEVGSMEEVVILGVEFVCSFLKLIFLVSLFFVFWLS